MEIGTTGDMVSSGLLTVEIGFGSESLGAGAGSRPAVPKQDWSIKGSREDWLRLRTYHSEEYRLPYRGP